MSSAAALAPAHGVGFRVRVEEVVIPQAPSHPRLLQLGVRLHSISKTRSGNWQSHASRKRSSGLSIIAKDVSSDEDVNPKSNKEDQQQKLPSVPSSSVSVIKRLDDVNPVGLGRRSRQIFDEVWRKFSELGQISRTSRSIDEASLLIREGGPMCEFAIPGAQNTTVLVVGATSRVGRIVVRKLMLRGYTVKALVRKSDQDVVDMLPTSVDIVTGDVGDPPSLKTAIEGCNKIIYCATARSTITGDLNRVDNQGVYNVAKAFQDYNNKLAQLRAGKSSKSKLLIAKFKSSDSLDGWEVRQGTYFPDVVAAKYDGGMDAKFEFTEDGNAVFSEVASVPCYMSWMHRTKEVEDSE